MVSLSQNHPRSPSWTLFGCGWVMFSLSTVDGRPWGSFWFCWGFWRSIVCAESSVYRCRGFVEFAEECIILIPMSSIELDLDLVVDSALFWGSAFQFRNFVVFVEELAYYSVFKVDVRFSSICCLTWMWAEFNVWVVWRWWRFPQNEVSDTWVSIFDVKRILFGFVWDCMFSKEDPRCMDFDVLWLWRSGLVGRLCSDIKCKLPECDVAAWPWEGQLERAPSLLNWLIGF